MIVSLTKRHVAAVRHFATERHMQYISGGVERGKKLDIAMPYSGWASLFQAITDAAYHEWGAARWTKISKGPGRATYEARQRIVTRLNEMDSHPAMLRQGVVGAAYERLVGFGYQGGERFRPYPLRSFTDGPGSTDEMFVLVPRHIDAPTLEHEGFSFTEPDGITVWDALRASGTQLLTGGEGLFLNRSDHYDW